MNVFSLPQGPKSLTLRNGSKLHDQSSCGLQVCQHPSCWSTNRKQSRRLKIYSTKVKHSHNDSRVNISSKSEKDNQKLEFSDGLPLLSVLDFNDSGVFEEDESMCNSAVNSSRNFDGSNTLAKLHLHNLHHHSPTEITPAPANTPLQSAHGFGNTPSPGHSSVELAQKRPAKKPAQTRRVDALSCKEYSMNLNTSSVKKLYLWYPGASTLGNQEYRRAFSSALQRAGCDVGTTNINFPEKTVAEDKATQPIKTTKIKKPFLASAFHSGKIGLKPRLSHLVKLQLGHTKRLHIKGRDLDISPRNPQSRQFRELLDLSYDELRETLLRAKAQGIMSEKEIISIFGEITNRRNVLPSIKTTHVQQETGQAMLDALFITNTAGQAPPPAPLKKNESSPLRDTACQTTTPLAGQKMPASGKIVAPENVIPENETSAFMRTIADSHLPREPRMKGSPLRRGVTYVSASADDTTAKSPLPKPFHYPRSSQGISLVPVATPSPLPPPTERDSLYDEAVGGSTVIVHPSAAPTLSDDNSCCDVALPKSKRGEQSEDGAISTKASSTKTSIWPQVNETAILDECVSNDDDVEFPLPTARSPSVKSARSVATRMSERAAREDASPAPPPPSPVVPPRSHKRAGTPTSDWRPPDMPRDPVEGQEADPL